MRPIPSRVLLSVITISAFAAGALSPKFIFFVLALGSGALLATSLYTSRRPLTRALLRFKDHPVEVRLCGAPRPGPSGALVLTAVNALGAGVHVFFSVAGGASIHLKVAQPRDPTVGSDTIVIGAAKYVQWNGKKISGVGTAPAVLIALSDAPVRERPGTA